jgi:hypothetical protein
LLWGEGLGSVDQPAGGTVKWNLDPASETDDVYVDYDDGYYFCNRRQPGIRLAITVAM